MNSPQPGGSRPRQNHDAPSRDCRPGLLAAWFGVLAAQVAEGTASHPGLSYAYDGQPLSGLTLDSTSDRGPPATYGFAMPQGAVDPRSHGISARLAETTSGRTTAFTTHAKFAQIFEATATTAGLARADDGRSVAVNPGRVAAKIGPRVGTAVPGIDDVLSVIPAGENLNTWGRQIWSVGEDGAESLIGAWSASELAQVPGSNRESAVMLREFYRGAAEAGKGGATAPVRVRLLDDIIRTLEGGN
jgi:hypothetical protein